MTMKTLLAAVSLSLSVSIGTTPPAYAQAASVKDVQVSDLRTMKDKFVGLAEAFPADKYGWTPMEGVRSVKDVLILITNEGNRFPTQWGAPAPSGVNADRSAEMARLQGFSKGALTAELGKAFDNVIGVVDGMDNAARIREIQFFGRMVRVEGAILMATGDMHEHLGQLIAYARTNQIVPPWSR
jgi:hypothetical protein